MNVYSERLEKLQRKIEDSEGFLITDKSNLFYLTGFPQGGYWGLITKDKFFLLLKPLLFQQGMNHFGSYQAKDLLKTKEIFFFSAKDLFLLLVRLVKKEKLKKVSFDPEKVSLLEVNKLKKIREIKFVPKRDLLSKLREIKDNLEISFIRQACRLAVKGFNYAKNILRPGINEHQVANEVEYYLKKQGAERVAFETIIAGGTNSSYPHHLTSNYVFKENDPILLDLGVVYQGYSSDLTRTIFLGKINHLTKEVYRTVRKAQKRATKKVKPGILACEVDYSARQIVREAGYAKYFLHNTGHGIGIDIHESPYLTPKNKKILKPGMVITIEPGIYIPQKFGVRIEDVILVTEKGCEILTGER